MGGECWGILRIFVKKGMENKGILARLKALLTGKRGMRLSEYLSEYRSRNLALRRGNSFDSMVGNMEHHLRQCLGSGFATLTLTEVDTDLCKRFACYLKRAVKNTGEPLSQVSAHHYFSAFRTMLGEAVADGLLEDNPAQRLRKQEIPRRPLVTKTYLEADEVARLALAQCRSDVVKRAFMFSCLTGLRLSDIRRLRWRDILKEGDDWRFSIIMQKTQEPMQSKLSSEACQWLGLVDGEHPTGGHLAGETVFPLPSNSTLGRILRQWTSEAGIMKPVTFHTARHSYATMALSAGADIYTISKLLGHRNINTTTIYAAIVDSQRDAAVESVGRLLLQSLDKYKE
jgi:integrase